jgi:hypothetical protein
MYYKSPYEHLLVLDASSRTRVRPDGTGGKSLNDLVCKFAVNMENVSIIQGVTLMVVSSISIR